MKLNLKSVGALLLVGGYLLVAQSAFARIGGGRSSGFRGSQGFSRSAPSRTYGGASAYGNRPFQNAAPEANGMAPGMSSQSQLMNAGMGGGLFGNSGGGFMRGLAGGIAGGFLGSMLARSFGHAGSNTATAGVDAFGNPIPAATGGGFGFLEVILLAGLGYFVVRWLTRPKLAAATGAASYGAMGSAGVLVGQASTEVGLLEGIKKRDPSFDLQAFKDERMDDFLRIQSAWNGRDLASVQNLIAAELMQTLVQDIEALKRARQINKIENIAVRACELVEAWDENGVDYVTLRLRAQLLDYTIQEETQEVVAGDRTQPVKFEEEWTFVRAPGLRSTSEPAWKLTAIAQV